MIKMAQLMFERVYVIDTSALINLKPYPKNIRTFKEKIWDVMEKMVDEGRLLAPLSVYEEVKNGGPDEISEWCKQHKKMFVDELELMDYIEKVKVHYDESYWNIQSSKIGPWADPWLIALSLSRPYLNPDSGKKEYPPIVNDEKNTGPTKIPYVAQKLGIRSLSLFEFFEEIGL